MGSWFWLQQVSSGTGDGGEGRGYKCKQVYLIIGEIRFFRSPRKRSSVFPWRRTDKVALKRMGWAGLPWRNWTRLLWRGWTTTRSWASPWGLVPEEREEDSRSPGRKNFLGCAGPRITREIITKTVIIKSTICSPRVTFGLSRLAPLDRLGCGWPRPAESPLLCLFNAGPAWEWYKHLKPCVLHLYFILSKHLHGRRSSLIPRSLCLSACYYCGAPEIRMCLTSSHRKVLAIRHEIGQRSLQRYFLRPKIFA